MQFSGFFAGQSEKMARGEFRPGSMANVICLIFTAGCPSLVRPIVSAISNPSDCWKRRKSLSSHHALLPDRKSVVWGKRESLRFDLGGSWIFKNKRKKRVYTET